MSIDSIDSNPEAMPKPRGIKALKEKRETKKTALQQAEMNARIISWTKDKYQVCKAARQNFERQWYINIAFYLGRQNVSLFPLNNAASSAGATRLYVPPVPYWRSRPVFNLIKPAIRTELAKLTAQKPTATIVPSSNDEKDMYAAQAGEQLWESVYRDKKLKTIFRQSMMWCLTTGNGFVKTYWDPNKRSGTETAPEGLNLPPEKLPPNGDFCFEAITPFHLYFPDMLCDDIEDQPFIIHCTTKTVDWVHLNYPGLQVTPNVMEASDLMNDSFLNLVGANQSRNNAVLCYEVWIKPGNVEFMPNGGMFTIVGDNVVQMEEGFSYAHNQYPYAHVKHIPANRFYGDSVIVDLVPIQREYNRSRGQIIENKNRMGHVQIIAQKGAVDAAKITTEPGQVVQYNLGFQPPVAVPPVNLPPYIMQEIDRLRMDFEDVSGQHDISKGQTPPGVTAATAISFLQEQDETMLSATFQSIEDAYEKIGYQTLCYVKEYWDVPRIVKVVGTDGQFNGMVFKGADIRTNTDIRIEAGSSLPTSKAARQALLMDLMSQGFIPPEKGLELMDMGGVQRLYDNVKIDNAQASRENMKMAAVTQDQLSEYYKTFLNPEAMQQDTNPIQDILGRMQPGADIMAPGGLSDVSAIDAEPTEIGMESNSPVAPPGGSQESPSQSPFIDPNKGGPLVDGSGMPTEPPLIVPVNSYDNHQVHIEAHNNYRKSQEFENLSSETKQLFEEHVNQHMQAMGIVPGMPMPTGAMMDAGGMQNNEAPVEGEEGMPPGADQMMQQLMGGAPPAETEGGGQ